MEIITPEQGGWSQLRCLQEISPYLLPSDKICVLPFLLQPSYESGTSITPPPPVPRRKPAVSPAAHSWHGELVGAWKAEINSWQRRIWCSSAIKAAGYKKHWPDWLFCRILKALACLIILWVSPASWVSSSWELECCCFLMPWCTVFITLFVHHPFSHPPHCIFLCLSWVTGPGVHSTPGFCLQKWGYF